MQLVPAQVKMKKTSKVRHKLRASSEVPMVRCKRIEHGACSSDDIRKIQKTTSSVGKCSLYKEIVVKL